MTAVLIRPAAAADLKDAFDWYEKQRPGLGAEFREAVRDKLRDIAASPMLYQIVHRETRRPYRPPAFTAGGMEMTIQKSV